ncbi:uncharacterized protein SPSK_04717 [Sporothrix schenckii 1099-18]|uniref:Protein kinase domain-containing protein n=1 Tax=Sporothrix schenckii 1099-18 TaxID=1397361 RepID=A0A0F2M5F1_SPOSC|nr:uncharacterized protein SPSK_04717 [Sporothrix schenckii 1099-18]KJR83421.1 hypothetical protein SPSK_04717 [Sporothrix schenckii 1099-18]
MPKPRTFANEGYKTVDASTAFEEEALPHYMREAFYPARNGDIIKGRYQLGAKMGYGTSSTVWLAQDLQCVPVTDLTMASCLLSCRAGFCPGTARTGR